MITPKLYGTVKDGQVQYEDPEKVKNYLLFFFKDDQEVEVEIKKHQKRRTSGQPGEDTNFNGYYWAVIVRMIADEIGEIDQELVHNWIQLSVGNFTVMSNGQKVPKGTSNMTGAEFSEYCSRVRIWAASPDGLNMFLPQPHEANY